jgi:hypothetical protein
VVEFTGPLGRDRLGDLLDGRGFDPEAYSLTGDIRLGVTSWTTGRVDRRLVGDVEGESLGDG